MEVLHKGEVRSVELTSLERVLIVRAANTERNLLRRLYPGFTPEGVERAFVEQIVALNSVIDKMEGIVR